MLKPHLVATALTLITMFTVPAVAMGALQHCGTDLTRALVLSGGGVKGAFEAGAVFHLVVHRGCDFQDLSGVSAGGLNASYLAQAPSSADSLAALQRQARGLVTLWRTVTHSDEIMKPRVWGLLGVALGAESAYDFTPLRSLIKREISVDALRRSGRDLRVGLVSFWDGMYREVRPDIDGPFLEYVYASALIPVFGTMPRIRETPTQPDDDDRWAQFGDGGIRHNTPVAGFFRSPNIKLLDRGSGVPDPPAHRAGVSELFVIVAAPYSPHTDEVERPSCCPVDGNDRHVRNGRDIVKRALSLALDASYRWDLNYATIANRMLQWRERVYEEVRSRFSAIAFRQFTTRMDGDFPIESFATGGPKPWASPYRLIFVKPPQSLGGTFDVSPRAISMQLREGCLAADRAMVAEFGGESAASRCEAEFPDAQ